MSGLKHRKGNQVIVAFMRAGAVLGLVVGTITGIVLGMSHPPTVAFAAIEGVILFGIPIFVVCTLLGVVAAGLHGVGKGRPHR